MTHPEPIFVCPVCGKRDSEDVAFICNTCENKEVKQSQGVYYCPQCETHTHPFQCRVCDSKEVAFMSPLSEDTISE